MQPGSLISPKLARGGRARVDATGEGVAVGISDGDPDAVWRRPEADPAGVPAPAESEPPPVYTGPPPTTPPPRQQPPAPLIQPLPPPRALPPQDHDAIDAEEQRARMVTAGVAIIGAVLALLLLIFITLRAASG
jgi:hypothetical protein